MENRQRKKFRRLIRMINWYPPYLFSGIKIVDHAQDFSWFKSRLVLKWYNKNLVGTAFGGSLYSMCDPFFMFILLIHLGEDYIVWDKYANIDFVKPGKGPVFAEFRLSPEEILHVKNLVDKEGKAVVEYPCEVKSEDGTLIAKLRKGLYVRKKNR
ncbi:PaaI family thioesterase [Algoriphagus sp. oki45]|uniref:PaaI family thioesterase n=1 Tax=Algoriphagus sp. oki45 TaxID=3067294 RepID=UPI0030C72366